LIQRLVGYFCKNILRSDRFGFGFISSTNSLRDFSGGGVFKGVSKPAVKTATNKNRRRGRHNQIKYMKNTNKVLMAAVVAVALSMVNYAKADGAFLSPRAQGNQIQIVAGSSVDASNPLTNRPTGNVRGSASARSLATTPGMDTTDLASGPRPTMSPKDPRYAQALQELREVQIAPLK
jgi:hypothetical protein